MDYNYKRYDEKMRLASLKPCSNGNGFMACFVNECAKQFYVWVSPKGIKSKLDEGAFYNVDLSVRYGGKDDVHIWLKKVSKDYVIYYHSK